MITKQDWDTVDREFYTAAAQTVIDQYIDERGADYDRVIDAIQDAPHMGLFATPAYITAELNDYDGDNIWEDIIYGLSAFDGAATGQLDDRGRSDRFVAAGIEYRYNEPSHEWLAIK